MIGAYFPCHKQLTAANEMLYAFRRYYPETDVVMVNDAGDERHEALGQKYGCKYFYETTNIGYPGGAPNCKPIIEWVKRALKYIRLIDNQWFLLLEDDVFIMDKVNEATLKYDINGINPKNILPWPCTELVHERGYCKDKDKLIYGAMGGAIFSTDFFKRMDIDQVVKDLTVFGEKCPPQLTGQNWYYSDVVLSYLTYLYGGTLGMYPGFAELWFNDLSQRLSNGTVATLNQYKFLYDIPPHPHLTSLIPDAYSIVLPTRGTGPAFDIFVELLLPRYVQYLNLKGLQQFIVITPGSMLEGVKAALRPYELPFFFYTDEEICGDMGCDGWMKQQIIKLAVCSKIKTDYYLIIDDDLIITRPLSFSDFFDEKGRIVYSYEAFPTTVQGFMNNANWWAASCHLSGIPIQLLMGHKTLMAVTPQVMITRIVHELLHKHGEQWKQKMVQFRATEFTMYWLYVMRTLRTKYYVASDRLFGINYNINVFDPNLTESQVIEKIQRGLTIHAHTFIVAQSWLNYPKSWIQTALK